MAEARLCPGNSCGARIGVEIAPAALALHRAWQADPERLHRSFNGRLRDELLNETLFTPLAQARAVLARWRHDYNTVRPYTKLGGLTPAGMALSTTSSKV